MQDIILERALSLKGQVIEWRHYFHQHPEVSWEEYRTSEKIAELLTEMGYQNIRIGTGGRKTGVIADLNEEKSDRTILLRADMDALPLQEDVDTDYKSLNDGVMHACGHDAHISMLLGAAKLLMDLKEEIPGRVRLLFQPAEESPSRSGAKTMVEEGILEGVDAAFGFHIWSPVASGKVAYSRGPLMASADSFFVKIKGKGGHGAMPHLGVDPTVAACQVVTSLNTIVSREINPLSPAVVSIGEIKAGDAFNIIPDTVFMNGTTRSFDPEIREYLAERIEEIVESTCKALRCVPEFKYNFHLPSTINDPDFADFAGDAVGKIVGEDNIYEIEPTMGAEDFSFILKEVPGAFMFLGTGNPAKETDYPHHHPRFKVDDDVLARGVASLANVAFEFLSKKGERL